MRVLFSSTWGFGHVFPMIPLALAFSAAGHEVLWAGSGQAPALVMSAGIDAVATGPDAGQIMAAEQRVRDEAATVLPAARAAYVFPRLFGEAVTPSMLQSLLPIAQEWHPDLLVHEQAEMASPLVGAVLGVPSVTHAFGGGIPADILVTAGELLAGLWMEKGQSPPPYCGSFVSGYLDICPPSVQTVPLTHVGNRIALRPVPWSGPSAPGVRLRGDARPLIYLTLGTVHNRDDVLSTAVRGLTGLDADVLVSVGRNGDPAALGPQPAHVQVERWVNQSEVLQRASIVVSHGGSGTFLGALGAGLPQLCLPQAADQFRNSTGLVQAGAGLVLFPDQMDAVTVDVAVRRLIGEPEFGESAAVVSEEIGAMPSPEDVVTALAALI
ncbi:MAG: hypothetical protein JWM76_3293 [Pseudonocardiales bacterium]|nr:hypothetical protein [Pseudonocardiales bacterium]